MIIIGVSAVSDFPAEFSIGGKRLRGRGGYNIVVHGDRRHNSRGPGAIGGGKRAVSYSSSCSEATGQCGGAGDRIAFSDGINRNGCGSRRCGFVDHERITKALSLSVVRVTAVDRVPAESGRAVKSDRPRIGNYRIRYGHDRDRRRRPGACSAREEIVGDCAACCARRVS